LKLVCVEMASFFWRVTSERYVALFAVGESPNLVELEALARQIPRTPDPDGKVDWAPRELTADHSPGERSDSFIAPAARVAVLAVAGTAVRPVGTAVRLARKSRLVPRALVVLGRRRLPVVEERGQVGVLGLV
jgi:hypothetical protein